MNGYPVRIMNETRAKLKAAQDLGLPDAEKFPDLHAYFMKMKNNREKYEAEQREIKEFEESPEGRKIAATKNMERMQREIKYLLTKEREYEREIERCTKSLELTKERTGNLYKELTQAQIDYYVQFPPEAVETEKKI